MRLVVREQQAKIWWQQGQERRSWLLHGAVARLALLHEQHDEEKEPQGEQERQRDHELF